MGEAFDADVVIIGAGPVGLMTAAELSAHGVSSILVEKRTPEAVREVKCNHVSARTMEALRRFGIADTVRDGGLPPEHPQGVAFRTSLLGREFGRIPIPSAAQRRRGDGTGPDTTWATPEPAHRINQMYLNPILEEYVGGRPDVELTHSTECVGVDQDEDGVSAQVVDLPTGTSRTIRARYLVGADGGRSLVRKAIGASFHGDPVLQHVQSTYLRAPEAYRRMTQDKAWGYYVFTPKRQGHVYAIDGRGTFLVHTYLSVEEAERGDVDRDRAIRAFLGAEDVPYEIISKEDWTARRLVADRFRDRRMFIAGDSAHLWVPMGGYGMNAGIADGLNLAWVLSAVVDGWADPAILDAYTAERQSITDQVSRFAMTHLDKLSATDVPAQLWDDTPEGEDARTRFGELACRLNVQQFAAVGLNFGYSYDDSPIIVSDGEAPAYTMGSYTPSTVPGCRLPHVWMPDGSSLYDHLGPWYTLVVVGGGGQDASEWATRARAAGLPIDVVAVDGLGIDEEAGTPPLIIAREDQHIAWRGQSLPEDVAAFAARLGADVAAAR